MFTIPDAGWPYASIGREPSIRLSCRNIAATNRPQRPAEITILSPPARMPPERGAGERTERFAACVIALPAHPAAVVREAEPLTPSARDHIEFAVVKPWAEAVFCSRVGWIRLTRATAPTRALPIGGATDHVKLSMPPLSSERVRPPCASEVDIGILLGKRTDDPD